MRSGASPNRDHGVAELVHGPGTKHSCAALEFTFPTFENRPKKIGCTQEACVRKVRTSSKIMTCNG